MSLTQERPCCPLKEKEKERLSDLWWLFCRGILRWNSYSVKARLGKILLPITMSKLPNFGYKTSIKDQKLRQTNLTLRHSRGFIHGYKNRSITVDSCFIAPLQGLFKSLTKGQYRHLQQCGVYHGPRSPSALTPKTYDHGEDVAGSTCGQKIRHLFWMSTGPWASS